MATIQGAESDRREIRVFISSTFRDFNEERYLLATQVFPDLNERAKERGVELVEVDLRWGITQEEAEVGHILDICLKEIENCKPYFIGMLGESYGTLTPAKRDIQKIFPDLLDKRPWLERSVGQASYTELEILHGLKLLSDKEVKGQALFYFRDTAYSQFKSSIGEQGWISNDPQDLRRLEALKSKIRASGYPIVEESLINPQAIATKIQQDLWRLIDQQFPASSETNSFEKYRLMHKSYGDDRRKVYLGGQRMLAKLEKAISDNQGLVLVTGESGFGKSALVANWQEQRKRIAKSDLVFIHHLGCGNEASEVSNVLKRFLRFASDYLCSHGFIADDHLNTIPSDWWALVSMVNQRLKDLSEAAINNNFRFIWVIDSLDRLTEDNQVSLPWIPNPPPPNVHIVVSSLPCKALRVLFERKYRRIRIEELTDEEREQIVDKHLRKYSRSLDKRLKTRLLDNYLAHSPLFIRVLLDELRKTATFEGLESKLNECLASVSVAELYEKILIRLEQDFGEENVKLTLISIWASRTGLSEPDLLEVTGVAPVKLFGIRLSLGDSLISSVGRLVFSHDYLRNAVENRYLKEDIEKRAAHEIIFNWQSKKTNWDRRKIEELPWQAMRAGKNEELKSLLLDVETLGRLVESWGSHAVYRLWVIAAPSNYWELDHKLADAISVYLESHKRHEISACIRIADLISGLLEEAGLYKELFLDLRRFAFRYSSRHSLGHEAARGQRFKKLVKSYHLTGNYWAYLRSAKLKFSIEINKDTSETLASIEALADLVCAQYLCSDYKGALSNIHEWLPKIKHIFGDKHPSFLRLISIYGRISHALGDESKARALLLYAVEGFHQCYGPNDWRTVDALLSFGEHRRSSAIVRECIARLSHSYDDYHPHLIRARNILCSVCGESDGFYSRHELLAFAEAVVGIGHPLVLEIKLNSSEINDKTSMCNILATVESVFGKNSLIAMNLFCAQASRHAFRYGEDQLSEIEHRYNDYIDAGHPRFDWYLLEASSEKALRLEARNAIIEAYSCLESRLRLCFSCLTTDQPTSPLKALDALGLAITTSLCKVPGVGVLATNLDHHYASRTHRAAYELLTLFSNITPTGFNRTIPDFHSIAYGYRSSWWKVEGMLWAGAYHGMRSFRCGYDNRSWWQNKAFHFLYYFDHEQMKQDGVADLEIVADSLLGMRQQHHSADDFLIGQAFALCAAIQVFLGKHHTSVVYYRQLESCRERYSTALANDPLIGLGLMFAGADTIMIYIKQLMFNQRCITFAHWFISDSRINLARALMLIGMNSQAACMLLGVRLSLKEDLREENRLSDSRLLAEAENMLGLIEVDPKLKSMFWCEY